MKLSKTTARSYDLHVYFDKTDAEFAHDFLSYNKKDAKARRNFFLSIQEKAAGLPIKTVKIFVAGVLVATLSMQAVSAAAAQADGFTPRFLNTQQQLSALQTKIPHDIFIWRDRQPTNRTNQTSWFFSDGFSFLF